MRKFTLPFAIAFLIYPFAVNVLAQSSDWEGEWITDRGHLTLVDNGGELKGKYKLKGIISGSVTEKGFQGKTKIDNNPGTCNLKLSDDGLSFEGTWQRPGYSTKWKGWKKDPNAEDQDNVDFSGVWLSSWGTLQLKQNGKKVTGSYGPEGWSTIEGIVRGKRLDLTWKRIRWSGSAWLEQTPDGKRLFGTSEGNNPSTWVGIKLEGFEKHVKPKAGEIAEGRTKNGILYHLRMPDGWEPGQQTDVVVLLHGSNWTTKGMVWVTAKNWPDVGRKFAILGIQGHSWAEWSDLDDLRFNYTYVNWMGKSTYEGYPYTDKESPYLVTKALDELSEAYGFGRWLVGGHSQGGYLTYVLHMHYPDKVAGTFPMAGGMIIQAEPDVFDDDGLIENQKETPMAIIHGKKDNVVEFSTGQYNYNRLRAHDFPHVKFMKPSIGHGYDFLPVGEAIEWLDMMSTNDAAALASYGKRLVEKEKWRDIGSLLARAKAIDGGRPFATIWRKFEDAAAKDAGKHLKAIQENRNGKWIDEYLAWQEKFITSKAGEEVVEAFQELRDEHDEKANELKSAARKDFRAGKRDAGYAKYDQIVKQYYASRHYLTTKESLKNR